MSAKPDSERKEYFECIMGLFDAYNSIPLIRPLSGTEEKACRCICEGINRPRGTAHELRGADKVLHGVHKEQT